MLSDRRRGWRVAGCRIGMLLLLVVPAACGFHVVGMGSWPEAWPGYRIASQLAGIEGEDFSSALQRALVRRGADPEQTPRVEITLRALTARKAISALDARGQAAEFELQRQLAFRVRAGAYASPELQVTAQRRLSFDPALALAKQQEEAQIEEALNRELIELLILRLEAELRALNPAGA